MFLSFRRPGFFCFVSLNKLTGFLQQVVVYRGIFLLQLGETTKFLATLLPIRVQYVFTKLTVQRMVNEYVCRNQRWKTVCIALKGWLAIAGC